MRVGIGSVTIIWMVTIMSAHAESFTLESPAFKAGARLSERQVFNGYGCHGRNLSPALSWHDAPDGTQSYALTVFDPDAPTGKGWWHWMVVDIPFSVKTLEEAAGDVSGRHLPSEALQLKTDFGQSAYGGACPPPGSGLHHYVFTLYALNVPHLDVRPNTSAASVLSSIRAHAIGSASLTAVYER